MIKKIKTPLIFSLILFSILCSILVGEAWDEGYNLAHGKNTLYYILSFGENYKEIFYSQFYSPIYWTFNFLITEIFPYKYQIQISHLINLAFSLSTVIAFGKIGRQIFNKSIGNILMFLIILYPIFFGHMAMNSKDTILALCHGWILYLIIRYLKGGNKDKRLGYIIKIGFLLAVATGIQFLFIGTFFTIILFFILEIFYFKKIISNNFSFKKFTFDIFLIFLVFYFSLVLFWPDTHSNILIKPYIFFSDSITSDVWRGWPYNLINGKGFLSNNVPKYYFFINYFFKTPEFIIVCYLIFFIFFKKIFSFYQKIIPIFFYKFNLLISILVLPLLIPFLVPFPIYDGLRLFMWSLPYFCVVPSLVLYFLYKNINLSIFRILSYFTILLFFFYFVQFILISPYQYTYLNVFNNFSGNKQTKFENDYWGISLNNLINKINFDRKKFNLTLCGVNNDIVKKYFQKKEGYKINYTNVAEADYVLMTNRVAFNQNKAGSIKSCFEIHKGEDIYTVSRLGINLSVLRKIKK